MKTFCPALLIAFLFTSTNISAQVAFQRTYGGVGTDCAYTVKQTTDGGYIIAGYTTSLGAGGDDMYLIKTNVIGDTLWTKVYGDSLSSRIYAIEQTADGGYIITGKYYLMKCDHFGNIEWLKSYNLNVNTGGAVQQTSDHGYIVAGGYETLNNEYDIYLIKTDSMGVTKWAREIGNASYDFAASVNQTSDGGFIITGSTTDDSLSYEFCLIKTDSIGNIVWMHGYSGTNEQRGLSTVCTNDGGYAVLGFSVIDVGGTVGTSPSVYLIKTDSIGLVIWSKYYDFYNIVQSPDVSFQSYSLSQTTDHGYFIAAECDSALNCDIILIKTDSLGDVIFSKSYGGVNQDYIGGGEVTNDGGYIYAGTTHYSGGATIPDIYLIKTDSLGNSGCNQVDRYINGVSQIQLASEINLQESALNITLNPVQFSVTSGATITNSLCAPLGLQTLTNNQESIIVSPNPFNNELLLNGTNSNATVRLFDISGKQLLEGITFDGETIINTGYLSPGFYFIQYKEKNYIQNFKVVKN